MFVVPTHVTFLGTLVTNRISVQVRKPITLKNITFQTLTMFDEADESLFSRVLTNRNHVLQSHLPDRSSSQYNLRKGAHDKELITKTSQLNERDFIIRMLYKNCY